METTRLVMKINSENIHVPELRRFIGKTVEIIIQASESSNEKKDSKMERFFSAAGKIEIDENAIWQLREVSKL